MPGLDTDASGALHCDWYHVWKLVHGKPPDACSSNEVAGAIDLHVHEVSQLVIPNMACPI